MAKRVRLKLASRKRDPEFMEFFRKHVTMDPVTGVLGVSKECYAHLGFNLTWKGMIVSVTYANAVWFMRTGNWPKEGYHIDHINDDALDNRPDNLQEITEKENQRKRRGRKIYRSYGTGKYGYGLGIYHDKRDNRFYVDRNLSRGHGTGNLQGIRYTLGGYDTLGEAEKVVVDHIEEIKINGLDYCPPSIKRKPKRTTVHLDANYTQMREMRKSGMTFQQIANSLGLRMGAVYKRTKDI